MSGVACHVKIRPVRLREPHPLLGVDAVRVVAYRAVCSCGWRGPSRDTVREARVPGREHLLGNRSTPKEAAEAVRPVVPRT